jgi:hypothetical protein
MKKAKNSLSKQQHATLSKAARSRKMAKLMKNHTRADCAILLEAEVGFAVTEHNVTTAFKGIKHPWHQGCKHQLHTPPKCRRRKSRTAQDAGAKDIEPPETAPKDMLGLPKVIPAFPTQVDLDVTEGRIKDMVERYKKLIERLDGLDKELDVQESIMEKLEDLLKV